MERRADPPAGPAGPPPSAARVVVVVVDEFLDRCQKHRAPHTYCWYTDRQNSFCATIAEDLTTD